MEDATITVKQISDARKKLKYSIANAVGTFVAETGVQISDVRVPMYDVSTAVDSKKYVLGNIDITMHISEV